MIASTLLEVICAIAVIITVVACLFAGRAARRAQDSEKRAEELARKVEAVKSEHKRLQASLAPPVESTAQAIDPSILEPLSNEKLAALAQSLAELRPLAADPKWQFGGAWDDPTPRVRARRQVWEMARRRREYFSIRMPWHEGTELALRLGSSSSLPTFIGGCISPNEFAFLDGFLKPGMTFFDVGANEGQFTIFAAKRVGQAGLVWAFEPSRREVELLKNNLAINQLSAKVFPCALAEKNDLAEFRVAAFGNEGLNTLGQFAYGDVEEGERYAVELKRLDDVIAMDAPARVDLIKLDVEGAELRVLEGAAETLRRYRPVILLEALEAALRYQGASVQKLVDFLRGIGYSILVFDSGTGMPAPAMGEYSDNLIALPKSVSLV